MKLGGARIAGVWHEPEKLLPLLFAALRSLEVVFLESSLEDSWLLGSSLAMAWAGLSFSDLQRLDLPSVTLRDGLGFWLAFANKEL